MHKWTKHVLFFNLPISFSAGILSLGWAEHIGNPNSHLFGLFNGSACLFLYNSHRFFKIRVNQYDRRISFQLRLLCIGTLTISLVCLTLLPGETLTKISILFPAFLLGAFYLFPDGKRGIRNIPFLKAPVVALTWTYLLIVVPLIFSNHVEETHTSTLLGFGLFFLALTLPFDLRDRSVDSPHLFTLPMLLGSKNTSLLGVILTVGCWLLFLKQIPNVDWKCTWSASALVLIIVMLWPTKRRNDLYYIGLDLMPGVLGILLFLNEN